MSPVTLKIALSLLFLLVGGIAAVVAAILVTRNSKNGERTRLIKQTTSGRWLLTVGAMVAFLGLSFGVFIVLVSLRHQIKPETAVTLFCAVLLIIQGVYKDYFRRDANGQHRDEVKPEEHHEEIEPNDVEGGAPPEA